MKRLKLLFNLPLYEVVFYLFLISVPYNLRILFNPETSYVSWLFNYHLGMFAYLSDFLLTIAFCAWFIHGTYKEVAKDNARLLWLSGLFVVSISLSLFHVKHIGLGTYGVLKWLEYLALLLIISTFNLRQIRISLVILSTIGIIEAILGLTQFHMQHMIGGLVKDYIAPIGTVGVATINTLAGKMIRAYGTLPHPNILGAFLTLSLIASMFWVSHETKKIKTLSAIGSIILLLGIFVSFSRLAWVAAVIVLIAFCLYYIYRKEWASALSIIGIGVLSVSFIFIFYGTPLKGRVGDSNTTSVSIRDRNYFNRVGMEAVKQNPWLGVGVGNYVSWMQDNYKLEPWAYQPPHNIFIFVAAELGLVGLLFFLALIWQIFRSFVNRQFSKLSFTLFVVGTLFLIMSQFDHYFATIQQGRLMFFVVLGLIAALSNLEKNNHVSV